MVRLVASKVLSPVMKTIKKAPPCAACLFAKAQRRAWRNRSKSKTIRRQGHTVPGKGKSVEHMISHQSGLISQVPGALTHNRYLGAVTMVDHASNFVIPT
eukprot:15339654-Ditylum_brightwellii.AAC.3